MSPIVSEESSQDVRETCRRGAGEEQGGAETGRYRLGTMPDDRKYLLERVDEAAVVQVYADGFRDLSLRDKLLVWHLYQAAIAGRDIFYDQRYAHNLEMRDVLEAIITNADDV